MSRHVPRVLLAGSHPVHRHDAAPTRAVEEEEQHQVTVVLASERLPSDHPVAMKARLQDTEWPTRRPVLSTEELETLEAPPDRAVASVLAFANAHHLEVAEVSRLRRDVVLQGTVAALNQAFQIEQRHYEHEHGSYRSHEGPLSIPEEWVDFVDGVLGLDDHPGHRPHTHVSPGGTGASCEPEQILAHYRFPDFRPAANARIALLEFGGGMYSDDLTAYLAKRRIPLPAIRLIEVTDGRGVTATNAPLDATKTRAVIRDWQSGMSGEDFAAAHGADLEQFIATLEVTMDAEIVAALAPGVPLDVVFASPSVDGWRRAIFAALGSPYLGSVTPRPDSPPTALSISWGMSEHGWGPMKLRVLHGALELARRMGTTVCCSTGDFGSRNSPQPSDDRNVNFPASSPAVLACGGTMFESTDGAMTGERAWKERLLGGSMASGGGMSGFFPAPAYQDRIAPPDATGTWIHDEAERFRGRWTPDVAASASFTSGITIRLAGEPFVGGGTSAATPMWAALATRVAMSIGSPCGWLTPVLYALQESQGLRSVGGMDNDLSTETSAQLHYEAKEGWDPCTGLGVPDGRALLEALRAGADQGP